MSETLNTPWIADYLINIAETYGSSLTNVPAHVKPGKKIQLLRFLTFQQYTEDDCVWAYVSDKHQQLPVRFSRAALARYSKLYEPDSQGKRFTQQRCAIAIIKSFKPVFQRVPSGRVGKMTIEETLALYVDDVQVVGGAGEPEFGSPRTLETHDDLQEWMKGLRAGDGSGNFLKLRKERQLAEERGEKSLTETSVSHEKNGNERATGAIRSEEGIRSGGNPHPAEQDDWRQSIAAKPLRFFKRPPTGTSALKSAVTSTNQGSGNSESPVKRKTRLGKGTLDLGSSPVITRDTENSSPARFQRQTTPPEWPSSPRRFHTPSSSPEPVEERPVSPPSTPPLFTPEQPQEAQVTELTETSQAVTTTPPNGTEATSLSAPTPAQRRRSLPPISSTSVYSSSLSTTNSRTKATSLPANLFESSASNTRRVPLPPVKFSKEAWGEVLVPSSDSGEFVTQSSPFGPARAAVAAIPKRAVASPRVGSSPERVNETYDVQSSIPELPEPERSQDHNGVRLDDLSRMALNGSYPERLHDGDDVRTSNRGMAHEEEAAKSPSPVADPEPSYPTLPPSSIPIHSQSPARHRSTTSVEETIAVEGTLYDATRQVTTKRARPSPSLPQDSLVQSKRPKLMSRASVTPNRQRRGATPEGLFDAELLKIGIKANLADYDNNPPLFPWGEGAAKLDLKQPVHPLLITNFKLAEIWKSVCRSRGWCE
ncbi:hypothetical protein EDB92DRAFT_1955403 [Lactarius akahatsu]|uniref:Telomere replication protein EST3 n=1 Tax=Lactarius akahatsu TaxID=416441 RepID=A0AAD4LAQ9_9AGAM|nr:hypothetical protein EDB92DRAFT_1955403 [Lactarius akahatsu]